MRTATTAALLVGAGTLVDKIEDRDLPSWSRPLLAGSARRFARAGAAGAQRSGFEAADVLDARPRSDAWPWPTRTIPGGGTAGGVAEGQLW